MAKGKTATVFFCQNCGYESTKWLGQCPGCREWNTFVEETIDKTVLKNTGTGSRRERREASEPCVLSEIAIREENKTLTGIKELDRVLGGGIVQGSLTLVGGDPGIGKSTLLLQVCHNLSEAGHKVLYISGEESKVQIKMRADRLGTFSEHMLLLCETNLDIIGEVIRRSKPEVVIIDSIQTMYNENVSAAPGSVSQVRESTGILLQLAKGLGISIFIVGHVTKEGTVAGPRVLEHMVDAVLYFEGERQQTYRIIRAIKNLKPVPHRLELIRNGRISISDDTYNGNPVGAKRALEVLREFDGRRVVVTPGLVELGKREKEENEILGKEIANVANLALIIGRNGEYIRKGLIENGFPEENALFFKKLSDAERFFPDLFSPNDAVLFLNDLPDELN